MKKSFIYLTLSFISLIFLSCKKEATINSGYAKSESGTDWEAKNLFGKVKSIALYKATYVDSEGSKLREPVLIFREEYTKFGSIKKTEYFDDFGTLNQTTTNKFDENQLLVKSLIIHSLRPYKSLVLIEYDTIENIKFRDVRINDSLNFNYIEEYDDMGRLLKQTSIEGGDTIIWTSKQEFDTNDQLTFQKISPSNDDDPQIFRYKYNSAGQIIESINGNEWMKFKSISEYDGETLLKTSDYVINADLKERLEEITEYDKYSNPINQKMYENSELNREFKNEYEIDGNGNWVKKLVSYKEHYANSKKFTPAYVETREIEYWR